jgi:hypothetical protein
MTFFGNFPTPVRLAGTEVPISPSRQPRPKPGTDAKLEGFRKTAIRFRAAPS